MTRTAPRGRGNRGLRAPGLLLSLLLAVGAASPAVAAAPTALPSDPDALVEMIRAAIDQKDYETFRSLVNWTDAGKIKQRIVRYEINRGLGRPIHAITFEDFPADGLAGVEATGKLVANMPLTHRVRVVYDEPVLEQTGKRPTAVFLVGKLDDAYRIGLVVRKPGPDDD